MTRPRHTRSKLVRPTSLVALVATLYAQALAAPEDAIREGSPGIPAASSALANASSRSTGQVSERTGAFSYQIPITVPPGRLGMSPSLGLSYSSDRPLVGGVAAGWSMGLPEITRDDSRGLESDAAWMSPHGRLLQFAEPGTSGSATHYRAWGDDSFTRYTRLSDEVWEARATSGIVNTFRRVVGVPVDDRFVLASSTDRFGNVVRYDWQRVITAGGLPADQLGTIEYTANDAAGIVPHARVTFVYGPPVLCGDGVTPVGAQLVTTASGALMLRDARPLTTIRTEVRDTPTAAFRPVREVMLTYRDLGCTPGGAPTSSVRLLETAQQRARSPEGIWTTLPAATFRYGELEQVPMTDRTGEDFTAGHWQPQPSALSWGLGPRTGSFGSWDWNELHGMLLDLDGDGDQDRFVAPRLADSDGLLKLNPHCTALVYRNIDGQRFSELAYPVLLPRQWHGKYCTLTAQPKIPPQGHVAPGEPTIGNGEYSPISISRHLDIDHDGLVDVVSAVFLPHGDDGTDDSRIHHPNCDTGVANPSWVVCGGPGDSIVPPVFPVVRPGPPVLPGRRNQYYNGRYVWRWYRNTGATGFDLAPRFLASPIPLDSVGVASLARVDSTNEFALVDLTGDGHLDAVWTTPRVDNWGIWRGDGNGVFTGNVDGSPLPWIAPAGTDSLSTVHHEGFGADGAGFSQDYVTTSLLDVNSDGRVDLVKGDPAAERVIAHLNDGKGFSSATVVILADSRKAHERLNGAYFPDGNQNTIFHRVQERRLADLDGDGLLDRVEWANTEQIGLGGGTVTLAFGAGPSLTHAATTIFPTSSERGVAASAYNRSFNSQWFTFGEAADIDGDGYTDLFGRHQLAGLPTEAIESPPGLLTRIESGRDDATIVRYASRTDSSAVTCSWTVTPARPCGNLGSVPRRVVRDLTLWSEGRSGPSTTSYRYEDPMVARDEIGRRGFRGFTRVRITSPSHGGGGGGEKRATRALDFEYSNDHRGLNVATRTFDETGRLLALEERGYINRYLLGQQAAIPVFLLQNDSATSCRPRTGTLAAQEAACRNDLGLQTQRVWSALGIAGAPPSLVTLWHETSSTQTGTGAAASSPSRRTDSERMLYSGNGQYLVYQTRATRYEVAGGTPRKIAEEITEHEHPQGVLALPRKLKTWVTGDELITALVHHDPTTGVLEWQQRGEQYRRAPTAPDSARIKADYGYDAFKLYANSTTNELGHVTRVTQDLGTGMMIESSGPNSWVDEQCTTCPAILDRTRVEIDGFGRTLRTWAVDDRSGNNHALALASTISYFDLPGTWGRVESSSYQKLGDATSALRDVTEIDGTGLVLSVKRHASASGAHALDALTSFQYDSAGTLNSVTGPDPSNDAAVVTHRSEHDALGREIRRIRPDETSISTTYDGVTVTRQEVARAGDADPGPLATTIAVVDEFGDLRSVTEVDPTGSQPTSYQHDGLGRVRWVTDGDGHVTSLKHDGAGRRTTVIRGELVWKYGYDHDGNVTSTVAPHGPGEDPVLYTTSTLYDALGRPTSQLRGRRDLTATELNQFGDGTAAWTYDQGANGIGRLRSVTTSSGLNAVITQSFGYDARGNPIDEALAFSVWSQQFADSRKLARSFDAHGKPLTMTFADQLGTVGPTKVKYEYDGRGLPSTARWLNAPPPGTGPNPDPSHVASLKWNRAGRLVDRAHALADQHWAHDSNGRLSSVEVRSRPNTTAPWSQVASQSMHYFAADDVRSMTTAVSGANASYLEDWVFDYDQRHQLTAVSGPSYEGLYSYTAGGRLSTVYVDGPATLSRDLRYKYLDPSTGNEAPVQLYGSHTVTNAWDLAGNLTRREKEGTDDIWTYRYDGADELREASRAAGKASAREVYWYDAGGQRVLALALSATGAPIQLRLWFGGAEIHYKPGGAVVKTHAYVSHGGSLARVVDRTRIEHTFHNDLGHLLASVDGQGVAIAGFTYSPFGELIRTLGNDAEEFRRRFNDKEHDAVTGLHYYGARYYDDTLLTWTQADPLYTVAPDGAGTQPRRALRYSFSGNNPLRYVDPDGRDIVHDVEGLVGAAAEDFYRTSPLTTFHEAGIELAKGNPNGAVAAVARRAKIGATAAGRGGIVVASGFQAIETWASGGDAVDAGVDAGTFIIGAQLVGGVFDRAGKLILAREMAKVGVIRPAGAQPRGGNGRVLEDGEGATPEEMAASVGGPTGGSRTGQAAVRKALLKEAKAAGDSYPCWRCGHESDNPADMHVGHRNVSRSAGGNLEPVNVCLEGAACNLSAGSSGSPSPGMSCAERGSCGAPFGR